MIKAEDAGSRRFAAAAAAASAALLLAALLIAYCGVGGAFVRDPDVRAAAAIHALLPMRQVLPR